MKNPIALRLPTEMIEKIDAECQKNERSRSQQIRLMLKKIMENKNGNKN